MPLYKAKPDRLYTRIIKNKLKLPNQRVGQHPDFYTVENLKKLTKDELVYLCWSQGVEQTACHYTHTARMRVTIRDRNAEYHRMTHNCIPKDDIELV